MNIKVMMSSILALTMFAKPSLSQSRYLLDEAQNLNKSLELRFQAEITILRQQGIEIIPSLVNGRQKQAEYFAYLQSIEEHLEQVNKLCDYSKIVVPQELVVAQLTCIGAQQDYALLIAQAKLLFPK